MSQLDRLLFNPDTKEWRNYKRRWLLGNANLQGAVALILLIGGLSHLVLSYFRINSQIPKGIPEDYYVLSLREAYPLASDILPADYQSAQFHSAELQVYPNWGFRRHPGASLRFFQSASVPCIQVNVTTEQRGYNFQLLGYSPFRGFTPQYREYQSLDESLLSEIVDSDVVLYALQDSWGNQILLENRHVGWPATLTATNGSRDNDELRLTWQLCYQVGLVAPGKTVCSPALISSGTQLASP